MECGLKACIAKLTKDYDSHGEALATLALATSTSSSTALYSGYRSSSNGSRAAARTELDVREGRSEDARYDVTSEAQARDRYDKTVIVLNWIRTQWWLDVQAAAQLDALVTARFRVELAFWQQ